MRRRRTEAISSATATLNSAAETIRQLTAERNALRYAIGRAKAIHRPNTYTGSGECLACGEPCPCPTVRLLEH